MSAEPGDILVLAFEQPRVRRDEVGGDQFDAIARRQSTDRRRRRVYFVIAKSHGAWGAVLNRLFGLTGAFDAPEELSVFGSGSPKSSSTAPSVVRRVRRRPKCLRFRRGSGGLISADDEGSAAGSATRQHRRFGGQGAPRADGKNGQNFARNAYRSAARADRMLRERRRGGRLYRIHDASKVVIRPLATARRR